jgi:hypothetical protein
LAPPALQRLLRSCLAPRAEERPPFHRIVEQLDALEGAFSAPLDPAAGAPVAAEAAAQGGEDCSACTQGIMAAAAAVPPPVPRPP